MDLTIYQEKSDLLYSYKIDDLKKGSVRVLITPYDDPSMIYILFSTETEQLNIYIDDANDAVAYACIARLHALETIVDAEEITQMKTYLVAWGKYCACRNSHVLQGSLMYEKEAETLREPHEHTTANRLPIPILLKQSTP